MAPFFLRDGKQLLFAFVIPFVAVAIFISKFLCVDGVVAAPCRVMTAWAAAPCHQSELLLFLSSY